MFKDREYRNQKKRGRKKARELADSWILKKKSRQPHSHLRIKKQTDKGTDRYRKRETETDRQREKQTNKQTKT